MRNPGMKKKYPRIYKAWQSIRQRCNNPNDKDYPARNKRIEKANKTGVNGVHMDRNKYRATIYVNSKRIDLGRYETLEEAAAARKRGEALYWGVTA